MFAKNTIIKNKKLNIHNNNFELNINNKQKQIFTEYSKYSDRFIKIIEYFKTCIEC